MCLRLEATGELEEIQAIAQIGRERFTPPASGDDHPAIRLEPRFSEPVQAVLTEVH